MIFMYFSTRNAKKNQARLEQERQKAFTPGTWVMTSAGFYGRFVDLDGEVVILENLDGVESLWARQSIRGAVEPPFAKDEDNDQAAEQAADNLDAENDSNKRPTPEYGALKEAEAAEETSLAEDLLSPVELEDSDTGSNEGLEKENSDISESEDEEKPKTDSASSDAS